MMECTLEVMEQPAERVKFRMEVHSHRCQQTELLLGRVSNARVVIIFCPLLLASCWQEEHNLVLFIFNNSFKLSTFLQLYFSTLLPAHIQMLHNFLDVTLVPADSDAGRHGDLPKGAPGAATRFSHQTKHPGQDEVRDTDS